MPSGPDGKLYAGTLDGQIYRFPINADGTLGARQVDHDGAHPRDRRRLPGAPARTIIGLAFDPASTADNPILWITDNYAVPRPADVPDWSGAIAG